MAVQKDRMQLDSDPAVETHLGKPDVYERIARARKMTPSQRRKAERDAARNKITLDLPEALTDTLETLARDVYQCPPSHLAAVLLKAGFDAIQEGRLDVFRLRKPSRVPRYEWFLRLPGEEGDGGWVK